MNIHDFLSAKMSRTVFCIIIILLVLPIGFSLGIERTISSTATTGSSVAVYLNITASSTYALEEIIPSGWSFLTISDSGCSFSGVRLVCSKSITDGLQSRILNYNVTSSNTAGVYNFSGTYSADSMTIELPISGNNIVTTSSSSAYGITRVLPTSVASGSSATVLLNVNMASYSFYTFEEIIPSGWIVQSLPSTGSCNQILKNGNTVIACVILSGTSGTVSYNLSVPADLATGSSHSFSGTYTMGDMSGTVEGTIAGSSTTVIGNVPDFSMSASSLSASVGQGNSTTTQLTVSSINGYNSLITLSAVSAPTGVTVSFNPSSGTSFASTATINVGSSVPIGNHNITLRGSGADGKTKETMFSLTITAAANTSLPTRATLSIDTVPVKGYVVVNGDSWGIAPQARSLDQGTYTIVFGDVSGYNKPANVTVVLSNENQVINRSYNAIQNNSCGDGVCNSGESCSSCSNDCGACVACIATVNTIDSDNLNLSSNCINQSIGISWRIDKPSTFAITAINLSVKKDLNNSRLSARKVEGSGLNNAYQYYNITTDINSNDINESYIEFAVRNSWIAENNVGSVSMNRYVYGWQKLDTQKIKNDSNFTYYITKAPGFSLFGISAQKSECPACNPPTAWSECSNGRQARTNYICDQTTMACSAVQETQTCCPACPSATDWSDCANGVQIKKIYECSSSTNYQCLLKEDSKSCITTDVVQKAMSDANLAITTAERDSRNVTKAKELYSRAQASFAASDLENAKKLADEAKTAAISAPKIAMPFFLPLPMEYFIIIIVAGVGAGAGFLIWKKKLRAPLCIVCARPTAMKFICNTCNGHVCFRDSKIYQGKIYCNNCTKRLGINQQQR